MVMPARVVLCCAVRVQLGCSRVGRSHRKSSGRVFGLLVRAFHPGMKKPAKVSSK